VELLCCQEAVGIVNPKSWPTLYDTDDLPKRKLQNIHRFPTAEMVCYLDFSVSTTGMLAGIKVSTLAMFAAYRCKKLPFVQMLTATFTTSKTAEIIKDYNSQCHIAYMLVCLSISLCFESLLVLHFLWDFDKLTYIFLTPSARQHSSWEKA